MASIAGLLLSGGASQRMGADKASMSIGGGRTLREQALEKLRTTCNPVVDVDREASADGPLAAMASGWEQLSAAGHTGPVLVLAVDMPNVTTELLGWLASLDGTCVPVADGQAQPLCARYTGGALAQAAALVAGGKRAVHDLLGAVEVRFLSPDEWGAFAPPNAFVDLDTPEDLP